MMINKKDLNKKDLDKRICDCEKDCSNRETYREFIRKSEEEFEIAPADLDDMSDKELFKYLEFIDELWWK